MPSLGVGVRPAEPTCAKTGAPYGSQPPAGARFQACKVALVEWVDEATTVMTLVADPVSNASGRTRPDCGFTGTGAGGRVVRGGGAGVRARVVGAGRRVVVARDAEGFGEATTDACGADGVVANDVLADRLVDDPLQPPAAIATRASPAQIRAE